jgi:integrase
MSLKLIKIKSSENWYVRGTYKGVKVFKSTETTIRKIAETELERITSAIYQESVFGKQSVITFSDAVYDYIEDGGALDYLGRYDEVTCKWSGLMGAFYNVKMVDITQDMLDIAAKKIYPNVKPQTLNRQAYTPFIAVYNHAVSKSNLPVRKWKRPTVKRKHTRKRAWFRPSQAHKFYWALPDHMKPLFTFLCLSGVRITEAIELEWKDVYMGESWAEISATKTDSLRGIPLHPAIIDELYKIRRKDGRVFRTHTGEPYKVRRNERGALIGGGYFKKTWATTRRNTGLHQFEPYSSRHTFNNWCIKYDIPAEHRIAIMGHSSDSTNSMYTDVAIKDLVEAVKALPDFRNEVHA